MTGLLAPIFGLGAMAVCFLSFTRGEYGSEFSWKWFVTGILLGAIAIVLNPEPFSDNIDPSRITTSILE